MKRLAIQAAAFAATVLSAHAVNILSPTDAIIAIGETPTAGASSYPNTSSGFETPTMAINGNLTDKYLNFGYTGTGLIVTTSAANSIHSFTITTANDSPERDPTKYEIWGTNSAIASADNSNGSAEPWTLVTGGTLNLPAGRNTTGSVVSFPNTGSFTSYKIVFPTTKAAANSVQIAEVSAYTSTDGSGTSVFVGGTAKAIDSLSSSSSPTGQGASASIDGNTSTKYLNFAKLNSGIIVTPSVGMTVVTDMTLTTGSDNVAFNGRSPSSYQIWGTTAAINSTNNSTGAWEQWTLISSGAVTLPQADAASATVSFANSTPYTSYRIMFPTIEQTSQNSVAVSEIQLNGTAVPEAEVAAMAGLVGMGLIMRRRRC